VEVRRDGKAWFFNRALNKTQWELNEDEAALNGGTLPPLDPYDNHLVMSLKVRRAPYVTRETGRAKHTRGAEPAHAGSVSGHGNPACPSARSQDFAMHPVAAELLHDGAAFQVSSAMNRSRSHEAARALPAAPPSSNTLCRAPAGPGPASRSPPTYPASVRPPPLPLRAPMPLAPRPQVLGVTNYSHWGDASAFRTCLQRPGQDGARLRQSMLRVATQRISRFSHVGTTDRLFDSAASALVRGRRPAAATRHRARLTCFPCSLVRCCVPSWLPGLSMHAGGRVAEPSKRLALGPPRPPPFRRPRVQVSMGLSVDSPAYSGGDEEFAGHVSRGAGAGSCGTRRRGTAPAGLPAELPVASCARGDTRASLPAAMHAHPAR
jgi:hypothetical protein